jgi:predicted ATP-grasp superfamily ATP-dependent carboligase
MLRVFVYEFLSGGGCWSLGEEPPSGSLLAEGQAMRDALASDFAALPDVAGIHLLHDVRLPLPEISKQQVHAVHSASDEQRLFRELAELADATIIIAPESSGLLLQRVLLAGQVQARLISPGWELVRLATDKTQAADYFTRKGIPVPNGIYFQNKLPPSADLIFPAVLKPNDGAGSAQVQRINNPAELSLVDLRLADSWRLEQFQPGIPASVSLLAGPNDIVPLQPCAQHLSIDGRFTYLGGSTPLPPHLARRAKQLALNTASVLAQPRGYLGIDMVLGSAENGADDFVIEINPRLTTSYIGLRRACEQNLAEALWKCVRGEPVCLTYRDERIEFTASG